MACALIIEALKKEANLYVSQGLYAEAHALYGRLLEQVSSDDPELKKWLVSALAQLKEMMDTDRGEENHLLNDLAITRIKKGWRGACSRTDLLVSARTLRGLGLYSAALAEYGKLLKRKYMTAEVADGVGDCLIRLIQPDQFPRAIDQLVEGVFKFPKNILMFKLLIARKINVQRHSSHFEALYRHLIRIDKVPGDLEPHIRGLADRLEREETGETIEDAYGPVAGLDELYGAWTRGDHLPPGDSGERD